MGSPRTQPKHPGAGAPGRPPGHAWAVYSCVPPAPPEPDPIPHVIPDTARSLPLAALKTEVATAPSEAWPAWVTVLRADGRAGAARLADALERKQARAAAEAERRARLWELEAAWLAKGATRVAGVDEAGRGPLAGPIVAAAVVWDGPPDLPQLDDSKRLTPEQREALLGPILNSAADWGVGIVDAGAIDRLNIQRANYLAMRLALADLATLPDAVLVDGFRLPETPMPSERVIKGDRRSWSIAAASIIAKVTRDHLMHTYHAHYPAYGFAAHKGYGTDAHMAALRTHGPSPIHRHSFAPVAAAAAAMRPA